MDVSSSEMELILCALRVAHISALNYSKSPLPEEEGDNFPKTHESFLKLRKKDRKRAVLYLNLINIYENILKKQKKQNKNESIQPVDSYCI